MLLPKPIPGPAPQPTRASGLLPASSNLPPESRRPDGGSIDDPGTAGVAGLARAPPADSQTLAAPLDRRGPTRHRRPARDPVARLRLRARRDRRALGGPRRRPAVLRVAVRRVPRQPL